MLFLSIFGDNVEDALGRGRYLLFYLLSGFAAAAAQILVDPGSPVSMVGASGAIAGVLAALRVSLYPAVAHHEILNPIPILWFFFGLFLELPAWLVIGEFFVVNLMYGLGMLGGNAPGRGRLLRPHRGLPGGARPVALLPRGAAGPRPRPLGRLPPAEPSVLHGGIRTWRPHRSIALGTVECDASVVAPPDDDYEADDRCRPAPHPGLSGAPGGRFPRRRLRRHPDRLAPDRWRRVEIGHASLAFRDEINGATIVLNGRCGVDSEDVPLSSLTQHLFLRFTEREIVEQRVIPFDRREAMRTVLTAKLDGVPMKFEVWVLEKDGCVYNLAYMASPARYDRGAGEFKRFVQGFATVNHANEPRQDDIRAGRGREDPPHADGGEALRGRGLAGRAFRPNRPHDRERLRRGLPPPAGIQSTISQMKSLGVRWMQMLHQRIFVGMVIAMQVQLGAQKFGGMEYTGHIIGLSFSRELARADSRDRGRAHRRGHRREGGVHGRDRAGNRTPSARSGPTPSRSSSSPACSPAWS